MKKHAIGIDEVGRGALAGPVVVAAVKILANRKSQIVPRTISGQVNRHLGKLKDSKKLSPKQRAAWFSYFKDYPAIEFTVARVYPRCIERMNVSRAANVAAKRACERLIALRHGSGQANRRSQIFLDGGLFLGNSEQPKNARTIVKGDEKIPVVAIASIIAKVHRDRCMCRLAKKYPEYGFEAHKGYGTKAHYKALKKQGPCDAHRMTFL